MKVLPAVLVLLLVAVVGTALGYSDCEEDDIYGLQGHCGEAVWARGKKDVQPSAGCCHFAAEDQLALRLPVRGHPPTREVHQHEEARPGRRRLRRPAAARDEVRKLQDPAGAMTRRPRPAAPGGALQSGKQSESGYMHMRLRSFVIMM